MRFEECEGMRVMRAMRILQILRVLRVNIQILNVSNIDFALSMIYGLSIRHMYSTYSYITVN